MFLWKLTLQDEEADSYLHKTFQQSDHLMVWAGGKQSILFSRLIRARKKNIKEEIGARRATLDSND